MAASCGSSSCAALLDDVRQPTCGGRMFALDVVNLVVHTTSPRLDASQHLYKMGSTHYSTLPCNRPAICRQAIYCQRVWDALNKDQRGGRWPKKPMPRNLYTTAKTSTDAERETIHHSKDKHGRRKRTSGVDNKL